MGALNKIAYLTGEYPRATDTFIQREVAALRDLGHEVETCSIRKTGVEHLVGPEQKNEAASTFYVLSAAKNPLKTLKAHWRFLRSNPRKYGAAFWLAARTCPPGLRARLFQLFYFIEAGVLANHLVENNVTQLHNHIAKSSCTVAMLASEMSGIPFSFTMHGPDIFFAPEHWSLGKKIEKARFVACISHYCRSQGMSFAGEAHWTKMHIVHCGVDPSRYGGEPGEGGRKMLFVGRLAAVKGLPILLEAMQGTDTTLTVIGDGPDRKALEQKTRDLGLFERVTFVGYKSQTEVAEALQAHDIFVLPSFAEGVPVVLMEAMAAARPVVTTKIAGVPELVENGVSGILTAPGDVNGLRGALNDLSQSIDKQIEMGSKGRRKVLDEFTLSDEAAWLSKIFTCYYNDNPPSTLRPTKDVSA